MPQDIWVLLVVGLVILLAFFVLRSIRIIPEYIRLVILALGRYAGTRGPGVVLVLPWEMAFRVDLRERFLEIPNKRPSPRTTRRSLSTSWCTTGWWMPEPRCCKSMTW